jgi:hypothetical protein
MEGAESGQQLVGKKQAGRRPGGQADERASEVRAGIDCNPVDGCYLSGPCNRTKKVRRLQQSGNCGRERKNGIKKFDTHWCIFGTGRLGVG